MPGRPILPLEGTSLTPIFADRPRDVTLLFEHEGNAAVRRGKWKLVKNFCGSPSGKQSGGCPDPPSDWELYDIDADRTELHDLAAEQPDLVADLADAYEQWAQRCGVIPRAQLLRSAEAWDRRGE